MFRPFWDELRTLKDDSLGIDLSDSVWRAYPFDLRLQANAPDEALNIPEVRDNFLRAVDQATDRIARGVCLVIQNMASDPKVLERAFGTTRLELSVVSLRAERDGDSSVFAQRIFGSGPLVGRSEFVNDVVASVNISSGGRRGNALSLPIAFVTLDSIEFQAGSLFSKENFKVEVIASVIAAIMSITAAPGISDQINTMLKNRVAQEEVRQDIEKNACVTFKSLQFPFATAEDDGARILNFDEHGISGPERGRRIALVQSLLGAHYHTNLTVDGVLDPDTEDHLRQFAKDNGLPASIKDKILRVKLAQIAHPFR